MTLTNIEKIFTTFDTTANILQEELSCTYLEALSETSENIFHGSVLQDELSELTKKRLEKEYGQLSIKSFGKEEIRKGLQLTILKGMKEASQVNHQMTPDAISLFVGYLVGKFTSKSPSLTLLDPAVGTGNLLTAILNHLSGKQTQSFGVDVDDLLINLAAQNANLQEHALELYTQDSLQNLYIEPVDVVVSDLPVGYYPDDVNAANFTLKANSGHSFAHYLFIEQSLRYTKPGGYLFFLVPNSVFEGEEASNLHKFLKEQVYIQGFLQLPMSVFKNESHAKSILILQKKGVGVEPPKQALLAKLPSFSNKVEMTKTMDEISNWIETEKNK